MHCRSHLGTALVGMFGSMFAPAAQAHALLDHAVPAVGAQLPRRAK